MASGFITLQDGTNWSSRWSRYDWVLETIMNELSDEGDEGILKKWIRYILPNEENGDVESGYCFYKNGGESILRIVDTRLMKDKYQEIFWNKVKTLGSKFSADSDAGYLVNSLKHAYELSLKRVSQPADDDDLKKILFVGGFEIGK